MLKKITLATLSLFLLTSLSACSKKDETPQSNVDSSDVEDTKEENKGLDQFFSWIENKGEKT